MNNNNNNNTTHDSNRQPLCAHDRQRLFHDYTIGIMRIAQRPEQLRSLLSPESIDHLTRRREMTESATFVGLLLVLALRGATAQDVACYVTTGMGELPFRGCEQALFDCLLNAMLADIEPPASATAVARETAAMIEHLLVLITYETGITRQNLYEMLIPANDNK